MLSAPPPPSQTREVQVAGRSIDVLDTGSGPAIVFVHGVWATGAIWAPVVARLAPEFRCVVPTLPLGVHRIASPAGVDKSPLGLARAIAELIAQLGLDDVTLVGNDTGGAIVQLVLANVPARIGRVVLTNCDAYEYFPPKSLAPLYGLARHAWQWNLFASFSRFRAFKRNFARTVQHAPMDGELYDTLFGRFAGDAGVREDLRQTIRAIEPRVTLDAARSFAGFDRDVLVLWGLDDGFFPESLGRRLAAAFPRARFEPIPNAKLFVSIDAPDTVAAHIAAFARV